jgi:hypothetical protein
LPNKKELNIDFIDTMINESVEKKAVTVINSNCFVFLKKK